MVKYKITFSYDVTDFAEYDDDEQSIEINEIDDDCFSDMFATNEQVKEFERWYNEDYNEEQVSIQDIIYGGMDEDSGDIEVILNTELNNEEIFAKELVNYMFEGEWPTVDYNVSGTSYEDYWDYVRSSPEQRTIRVDYDDKASITHFDKVIIKKLN